MSEGEGAYHDAATTWQSVVDNSEGPGEHLLTMPVDRAPVSNVEAEMRESPRGSSGTFHARGKASA